MLKKTQFQLIISYFVYYIYFKKCQNLLLSRGFIAWTRTNYKIELQITREKMGKTGQVEVEKKEIYGLA